MKKFGQRFAFRAFPFVCFTLVCGSSAVAQEGGYQTKFNEAAGWTLSGMWAVDGTPAAIPIPSGSDLPALPFVSAPFSLNYNNGQNYATGSFPNSGKAVSPVISLGGLQNPILTFWCNAATDSAFASGSDVRSITLTPGNGLPYTEGLGIVESGPSMGNCQLWGTWHKHTVLLNPTWVTVQVTFTFDTVDGTDNDYSGWFIDDLKVFNYASVQSWDFDSGLQGWTVTSSHPPVVWAADAAPASVVGAPSWFSAPHSLNYNNGVTFASGTDANNGTATSPEIDLTGLDTPRLVFRCNYQTENAYGVDVRGLQISKDDFSGTLLEDSEMGWSCGEYGTWHTHILPLESSWGTVRIRFRFDSGDGVDNSMAGWFLDDVRIEAIPATSSGFTANGGGSAVGGSAQTGGSGKSGGGGGCGGSAVGSVLQSTFYHSILSLLAGMFLLRAVRKAE